jgi:hypothetical protein
MNTQLITYSDPKLFAAGAKLFPVRTANDESPEHHPSFGSRPLYTVEEIRLRVETMTPLLKGILDFGPPKHWGINE